MKLGYKTDNAKWIYNTETNEIRCLGDTSRFYLWDRPSLEFMWKETNGCHKVLCKRMPTWRNLWNLFGTPYWFEPEPYFWYGVERQKALSAFEDKLGYKFKRY